MKKDLDIVSNVDSAVVLKQADLDFNFIQVNVRDLSVTAQFSNMEELAELHKLAYTNLKEQMQPNKPLAVDPSLVLEAYKTISAVAMQTVETKRKATETLIKARSIIDVPLVGVDKEGKKDNGLLGEGDVFDEDVSKASVSTGTGMYGGLLNSDGDPEM